MESFHFSYVSIRYLIFQIEGRYYLLDRSPRYFIGYILLPLNWFFYQRVYPITNEDYLKIEEKHSKASKFTIPSSFAGGLAVFLNAFLRINNIDTFKYFNTDLLPSQKVFYLLMALPVSILLYQVLHLLSKKNIQRLLGTDFRSVLFYRIKPEKPFHFLLRMIGFQVFGIGMITILAIVFFYSGNIEMLIGSILMMFVYLILAYGVFSPNEKWKYKIVDVASNSSNDY